MAEASSQIIFVYQFSHPVKESSKYHPVIMYKDTYHWNILQSSKLVQSTLIVILWFLVHKPYKTTYINYFEKKMHIKNSAKSPCKPELPGYIQVSNCLWCLSNDKWKWKCYLSRETQCVQVNYCRWLKVSTFTWQIEQKRWEGCRRM